MFFGTQCRLEDGGGGRGDVLRHVKREGELSGRGNARGICPEGYF